MEQKRKIIITGATGFIGQHLLEDVDCEKYDITIITRNKNKTIRFIPPNTKILEADLLNPESLKRAFDKHEVLINLAAEVRDPSKLAETNINGTKNIIEAITHSGIEQVIHLSSVGVVGKPFSDTSLLVDETITCTPQNEYERTKYAAEQLLAEAAKKHSWHLTIVRPTNVFGEFHAFNALLRMIKHIQSGTPIIYQKTAVLNYVYVKDLTKFICNLLDTKEDHGIVNVGEAEGIALFIENIAKYLDVPVKPVVIPSIIIKFIRLLGIKVLNPVSNHVSYSDQKLKSFYSYSYGTKEGLKRTIGFYKKQNLLK